MQEGQYVRTIYGIKRIDQIICGQDVRFDNTDGFDEFLLNYHNNDGISMNSSTWKEIVIGEPKENIIDLIETGDYVNGHRVLDCDLYDIDDEGNDFRYIKTEHYFELNHWIKEREIKSIITKEQFERMEYKI